LQNIRQGKRPVALYAHEFRGLLRLVPSLDSETALEWFLDGLHPVYNKQAKRTPQSTLPDPNAMDMDTLQVTAHNHQEVNALRYNSGYNNNGNTSNAKGNRPRLPKLTDADRAYLIANDGCFKCRKLGHMTSKCRTFPNQPQQGRQFNNMELDAKPAQHTCNKCSCSSQTQAGKDTSN
ncbi:hypothetical protein BGX28_002159, partial [Mortierella sp. GBA30]